VAQWIRTGSGGNEGTRFHAVAEDAEGNVYAAGECWGKVDFRNGVSARGKGASGLVVKYDQLGNALWARSDAKSDSSSILSHVAVDVAGNVYVVGALGDNFDFGNGVRDDGTGGSLVKFGAKGAAQWFLGGPQIKTVALGANGEVYVAGMGQDGFSGFTRAAADFRVTPGRVEHGAVAFVAGIEPTTGKAIWAVVSRGTNKGAMFEALAIDGEGNMYAAGNLFETGDRNEEHDWDASNIDFGNGVKIVGRHNGPLLVKYDSSGRAQWARTPKAELGWGQGYSSMTLDLHGGVYLEGRLQGSSALDYGEGMTLKARGGNYKKILVKYNGSGEPEWTRELRDSVTYSPVVADEAGVYLAGVLKARRQRGERYLIGFDFSGNEKEMNAAHGIPNATIRAFLRDGRGNTVFAGDARGIVDLGNGVSANSGGGTCFVAKYTE
jgi:hypothetical protein